MLRGKVFSNASGYAGIPGNVLLIAFEIILAFVPKVLDVGMVIAGGGGLSTMIWCLRGCRRLLQLGAPLKS